MTEREKMLAGQLYDCGDAELLAQWHKAKDLVRDYNQTDSANAREKERILSELLGGKGKNLWITAPFYVDYGNNIYFGNNCEVNMNCTFLDDNIIRIGDNALIAPNVQIYTAFHPTNAADRFGGAKEDGSFAFCKTQTAPVVIGNDVWIGGGAIIMPGVTIGNNVVIGAGSVVTKDIPDHTVAFGNPCRVVRENDSRERSANMDCIFCKIISGELPGKIVYEDEYAVVFMDIAEDVDGHMLAAPRKHVKNILDCDPDTLNHLMAAVKKVAAHCTEKCGYDGVNLLNASGESAGQSVPHFHIHIIPRKKGDGIDAWPAFPGAGRKLEEVYEELKMTGDAVKSE